MDINLIDLAGNIRTFLKSFDPQDPVQALCYLEVLSALKEEKEEKRLKAASYSVLDAASPEGEFEFNGLVVTKVSQTKTAWNKTADVTIAEANLAKAKKELEAAQRAAGFQTVPGPQYWVMKKLSEEDQL